MKVMIIMRGIPGSGKSTLANKLMCDLEQTIHSVNMYSTDDFWYDENNRYVFDIARIGEAHAWNFGRVADDIDTYDCIIVDNTNIVWRDFKRYIELAIKHGNDIMLAEPQTMWKDDIEECDQKNTHNVPKATIDRMFHKYQGNEIIITHAEAMMERMGQTVEIYEYSPLRIIK